MIKTIMTAPKLMSAKEYGQQLANMIPHAKRRVIIAAMIVANDAYTQPLLQAALEAQQRGVQVHILVDRFSLLPLAFDAFLPIGKVKEQTQAFEAFAGTLRKSGGRVSYVGKKWSLNPFAGRLHAKFTVIDDAAFTFGGVNFSQRHFELADYMFLLHDQKLSDRLAELAARIARNPILEDQAVSLSATMQLLFDGGTPGKSIIYEHACDLAEKAVKIYYVSQMCPSGKLGRILHRKKAQCYFNRPSQSSLHGGLGIAVDQRRFRLKNLYKGKQYIHAKFILFEMPDGTKALMSGSNNFSWRGIAYGTKEIAMYSTDSALWERLYQFMKNEIVNG